MWNNDKCWCECKKCHVCESHTKIFWFTMFDMWPSINSVSPLYLIFNKVNGYFEQINGSKYLTLVPTNESKEKN